MLCVCWVYCVLQAQSLPAELADARITFKQFQDMNMLRRHMYMLSFALDFCAQVSNTKAQRTTSGRVAAATVSSSPRLHAWHKLVVLKAQVPLAHCRGSMF
jgi:hypothetical protein